MFMKIFFGKDLLNYVVGWFLVVFVVRDFLLFWLGFLAVNCVVRGEGFLFLVSGLFGVDRGCCSNRFWRCCVGIFVVVF